MRRRTFITLLGGAAAMPVLAPLAARAQAAMPVVGVLYPNTPESFESTGTALRRALRVTPPKGSASVLMKSIRPLSLACSTLPASRGCINAASRQKNLRTITKAF